ncbi:MAG: type II toxin-antitoxin system mRNA interferase toxin, RelE/StbE family [Actinomycetia bacterium]|nr:type II toxin-antitoxin system mRNA interferase toxin, RelE/StbE family [Actinomycetes bacterium]
MNVLFSDTFIKSLKKFSSIEKAIKKKIDMIVENPIAFGEPLKGNFRGYYSCPVRKNFIIIYLYCSICRRKGDDKIVICNDCSECPDDTIKFVALGPHDRAYKQT